MLIHNEIINFICSNRPKNSVIIERNKNAICVYFKSINLRYNNRSLVCVLYKDVIDFIGINIAVWTYDYSDPELFDKILLSLEKYKSF